MSKTFEPMNALEAYFAGEIESGEAAQLRAWIEANPVEFAEVADRARIHSLLSAGGVRLMTENIMENVLDWQAEEMGASQRGSTPALHKTTLAIPAAAAALSLAVVVSAAAAIFFFSQRGPVGTVVAAEDVVWKSDSLETGEEIKRGEIHIESGQLAVRLKSRAELKIEGAAQLDVVDANTVLMHHGAAEFHCPPEARGFSVTLPGDVEVIDLGTDFEVTVGADGNSFVTVTQGRVEVRTAGQSPVTLDAGQQVAINRSGNNRVGQVAEMKQAERWRRRMDKLARNKQSFLILPLDGNSEPLGRDEVAQMIGNVTPVVDRFGHPAGASHFDGNSAIVFPLGWPPD
ncbi:MAG: hypothetical protein N2C14_25360, partial [Planctomycetales bacterium]